MKFLIEQYKLDSIAKSNHKLAPGTAYMSGRDKAGLICPHGHEFSITWANWNKGGRCPVCRKEGTLPCRVYYLQFDSSYKIGITAKTLDSRWSRSATRLLQTALCRNEAAARRVELRIKQQFSEFALPNAWEFFDRDVLFGKAISDFAEDAEIIPEKEAIVPLWSSCLGVQNFSREKAELERIRQWGRKYSLSLRS